VPLVPPGVQLREEFSGEMRCHYQPQRRKSPSGGHVRPAALLVFLMIVCTMASQYGVVARMDALKLQMGSVSATPASSPLRVLFDRLHQYSVCLESAVLLSGLVALFLAARQMYQLAIERQGNQGSLFLGMNCS
jgi:hypothetical protein